MFTYIITKIGWLPIVKTKILALQKVEQILINGKINRSLLSNENPIGTKKILFGRSRPMVKMGQKQTQEKKRNHKFLGG
jgi:hypothetical protein